MPGGRHGNDFDVPEAQMIQGLVTSLGTERRVYVVTPGGADRISRFSRALAAAGDKTGPAKEKPSVPGHGGLLR